MLNIRVKCKKLGHRQYNPEKHGEGGIKGACDTCTAMWRIWRFAQAELERLRRSA